MTRMTDTGNGIVLLSTEGEEVNKPHSREPWSFTGEGV